MKDRLLIICCGIMLSLTAISCEIVLPSMFALEQVFAAARADVQRVIPVFIMAVACGQIVFGPLSDRYGRRPMLLIGLALYISGAFAALFAPTIGYVYAARVLQGFGAACLVVVSRAVLRDVYSGQELGRAMAMAMGIFTIGPMFAPMVGVLALWLGGWRGPFVGMVLVGFALLAVVLLLIRETLPSPDIRALEPARLLAGAMRLFKHPQSRHFLLTLAIMQVVISLFISTAPQIFRGSFGVEGTQFALLFAFAASGIVVGQVLNTRLISRFGVLGATRICAGCLAVIAIVTAATASTMGLVLYMALLWQFNMWFLIIMANSVSMVLDPHREIAGLAAALMGFVTQLSGSGIALLMLPHLDGTLTGWSVVHAGLLLLGVTLILVYRPVVDKAVAAPTTV